jgi:hypothetical protein
MAMTFGMTGSPESPLERRFFGASDSQPRFPDVCVSSGKWFRAVKKCFVAAGATKQSGTKSQQFQ